MHSRLTLVTPGPTRRLETIRETNHTSSDRLIPLRRPPILNVHDEQWVPDAVPLALIDERWEALCASNDRFFDGSVLQVLGVVRNGHGGVTIHVAPSSYRFYAVQRTGIDTGARILGVKALCRSGAGWLMGRRSASVAYYPEHWEFVPGGSVPVGEEPADVLMRELAEESGWSATSPPRAVAVLYDPGAYSWEIVSVLDVEQGSTPSTHPWEYGELAVVEAGREPEPLAKVARAMIRLRDGLTS